MTIIFILSALICWGYITLSYISFAPLQSISSTYYKWHKLGWMFQAWALGSAFTLLPCWLEITDAYWQFVAYLSCVALGCVGLVPDYKGDDRIKHYIFTFIAMGLSLTWAYLTGILPFVIGLYIITILVFKRNLFWIEIAAFLSIYGAVGWKLFS